MQLIGWLYLFPCVREGVLFIAGRCHCCDALSSSTFGNECVLERVDKTPWGPAVHLITL